MDSTDFPGHLIYQLMTTKIVKYFGVRLPPSHSLSGVSDKMRTRLAMLGLNFLTSKACVYNLCQHYFGSAWHQLRNNNVNAAIN